MDEDRHWFEKCNEAVPSLTESPCRNCPHRGEMPKCLDRCSLISAAQELMLQATEGKFPSTGLIASESVSPPSSLPISSEQETDKDIEGEEEFQEVLENDEDEAAAEEEPSDAIEWEDVKDSPDWVEVPAEVLVARFRRHLKKF